MPDSLQPHGLLPAKFLCPWDSPGKNTGVGFHLLIQGSSQPVTQPASLKSPALASVFFTTSTTWELKFYNVLIMQLNSDIFPSDFV